MAVSLWRAIPLHRSIQAALYPNIATMVTLPSGFPAWRLDDNLDGVQIDGVMRRSYADQDFTLAITWTVGPGTTGTPNINASFRRHILGFNAFIPQSPGQGVASPAPAQWVPTVASRLWTKAETQPIFEPGLGGIGAGDKFRLALGRSGSLTGPAYVLGIEMWVP